MSVTGDRDSPAFSGDVSNWIGIGSGVLGIASILFFFFVFFFSSNRHVLIQSALTLVLPTLALILGVAGTMKSRREGQWNGIAVAGLSLGLLTILLFTALRLYEASVLD